MIQHSAIEIKSSDGLRMINTRDIIYIEAAGKFSIVHTRESDTLIAYNMLKIFGNSLPVSCFFRNHYSYIISFSFVKSYSCNSITMINSEELPLSRRKLKSFKRQLKLFLESQ